MTTEPTEPLDVLKEAIRTFANRDADHPILVDTALVIWEEISISDDGDVQRCIQYAIPTDNFSMTAGLGMVEAARTFVRRDIFGRDDE